jgi:hypothetical protein
MFPDTMVTSPNIRDFGDDAVDGASVRLIYWVDSMQRK